MKHISIAILFLLMSATSFAEKIQPLKDGKLSCSGDSVSLEIFFYPEVKIQERISDRKNLQSSESQIAVKTGIAAIRVTGRGRGENSPSTLNRVVPVQDLTNLEDVYIAKSNQPKKGYLLRTFSHGFLSEDKSANDFAEGNFSNLKTKWHNDLGTIAISQDLSSIYINGQRQCSVTPYGSSCQDAVENKFNCTYEL